jgi:glycosyltransferase involved in cell wall biosynthesis
MNANNWIIFFGEDWGRHPSTGQHLAKELAQHHQVLWVNSMGLRAPELTVSDIQRAFSKLGQFAVSLVQKPDEPEDSSVPENIHVVSPIAIPLLKYAFVRRINHFLVTRYLTKKLEQLGIVSPLLITSAVESVDVVDELGAIRKAYYCADEYSEIAGLDSQLVTSLERELLQKIDVVIATSSLLQRSKSQLHNNVQYLPHGVDFKMFSRALQPGDMPQDISSIPRPMVGFVGLLGEHINYHLIKRVADEMPEVSVVLIGPLEEHIAVPARKNIFYLGPKPYTMLPAYLAHFAVCTVPYAYSDRNKFANPTKLREYLAAGCPVVSTLQMEAGKLDDYVDFADDEDEFVSALRRVIEQGARKSGRELSAAMREHSWEARANTLLAMIVDGNDSAESITSTEAVKKHPPAVSPDTSGKVQADASHSQ